MLRRRSGLASLPSSGVNRTGTERLLLAGRMGSLRRAGDSVMSDHHDADHDRPDLAATGSRLSLVSPAGLGKA